MRLPVNATINQFPPSDPKRLGKLGLACPLGILSSGVCVYAFVYMHASRLPLRNVTQVKLSMAGQRAEGVCPSTVSPIDRQAYRENRLPRSDKVENGVLVVHLHACGELHDSTPSLFDGFDVSSVHHQMYFNP